MRTVQMIMGTAMSIDIRAFDGTALERDAATQAAFDLVRADDLRFSTYRRDSEVSAISDGRLALPDASARLRAAYDLAQEFGAVSDGAFGWRDPAGRLDLNGLVKGWSVQQAADLLSDAGATSFCVNAGGDVIVRGRPRPDRDWQVAVRSPGSRPEVPLAVLAVRDGAVATSGSYERGPHIWDPRTGAPVSSLSSVTVVTDSLLVADVLATTIAVLGPDGVDWAPECYACAVLAVTPNGELLTAGSVREHLAPPASHRAPRWRVPSPPSERSDAAC